MATTRLGIFACLFVVFTVCCSSGLDADQAGGQKPADGASGVCCEPTMGGCANLGGYIESGTCKDREQCDGMCNQQIVDDVHGCKRLVYSGPAAGADPISCGPLRRPDSGAAADAGSDASTNAEVDGGADAASDGGE